jgi:hypothetical protein
MNLNAIFLPRLVRQAQQRPKPAWTNETGCLQACDGDALRHLVPFKPKIPRLTSSDKSGNQSSALHAKEFGFKDDSRNREQELSMSLSRIRNHLMHAHSR